MRRFVMRRQAVRKLGLESLEDRRVLSGDVKAFVAGHNLFVFGDNAANEISLTRDGNGAITLSSLDGTTRLNHQTDDLTFGGVTGGIFIWTYGGADVVQFASSGDNPFRVGGSLFIDTGSGNDTVQLSNVVVAHTMTLLTGKGNDKILAPGNALEGDIGDDQGVIVRGVSIIVTGGGSDQVVLGNSQFRKFSLIDTVGGNDQVILNNAAFQRTSLFIGGSGNDTLSRTDTTTHRPIVISFENRGDALAPTAVNDSATVAEGASQSINVAANDFDVDGNLDPATITITQAPAHGTATANANGTVTYTHDGSETTSDSFKYTIKDTSGKTSNVATASITVTPVNDAPVANNDAATVAEGSSIVINVASNDSDAENALDLTSIVIGTSAQHGQVTVNNDGTVTYLHDGSETTSDSFTYTIKDTQGLSSNIATVTITITPVNDPPVAVNDSATVAEGGTVVISVAANDSDAENGLDLTSVTIVTSAQHGQLTVNNNGTVTYVHDGSETTSDSFTYTIKDTSGAVSNIATVTITITPVNDAPVANNDSATVDEGQSVVINLSGNDTDAENALDPSSIVIGVAPQHGSVTVHADGTVTYQQDGSETTSDSFTYTIKDLQGLTSNTATVTITINPVNDAPLAGNDSATVDEGDAVLINLIANDSDAENQLDPTSIEIVADPQHGSLVIHADGTVTYTHDGGETLSDSFTYTIKDLQGNTSNTATVTITVNPVNDPPVANDDATTVAVGNSVLINLAANDTDPENQLDLTSIAIVTGPAFGSIVIHNDGTVTYTQDGSDVTEDSFTYTIQDQQGATSNVATVTLTITAVNNPPVANDDSAEVTEGDSVVIDLAGNDTDTENQLLLGSIDIVSAPLHGSLVVHADGTVTYTHDGTETTSDSFTYTIQDAQGATSNAATVSITINTVNDAPIAVDDMATVAEGDSVLIDLAGNDTDEETGVNPASIVIVAPPAHGELTLHGDGTVTYQHDGSETLGDSFTYTIEDTDGNVSASATVTITVTPVNDTPVANDDASTVAIGNSILINVAANDTDAENALDLTSIAIVTGPAFGSVTIHADGTVTYTQDGSSATEDSFTYTIQDADGATSNTATVTITITATNDPPVANDDSAAVDEGDSVLIDLAGNDTDAENQLAAGTINIVSGPLHGSLVVHGDGTVTYTHDGTETTSDSFTYTIDDAQGATSNAATVTLAINTVNDDPVAVDDEATVAEGGSVLINLAGNDTDEETGVNPASIVIVTPPAHGELTLNGDGTVTYLHDGSETASDSFSYTIEDADGNVSTAATVTITITPVNDPPHAVDDFFAVLENSGTPATGNVLDNDDDGGDGGVLSVVAVNGDTLLVGADVAGQYGVFHVDSDGSFTYTVDQLNPDVIALGSGDTLIDQIAYTISDGVDPDSATVSVTINGVE